MKKIYNIYLLMFSILYTNVVAGQSCTSVFAVEYFKQAMNSTSPCATCSKGQNFYMYLDYNNDGKQDMIISEGHRSGGVSYPNDKGKLYFYLNTGTSFVYSGFSLTTNTSYLNALSPWSGTPDRYYSDFNSDGIKDFLVLHGNGYSCYNQVVEIFMGKAAAPYFETQSVFLPLKSPFCIGAYVMDLNNDKIKDIYIENMPASCSSVDEAWVYNKGKQSFESLFSGVISNRDYDFRVWDFDKDGKEDLLGSKSGWADGYWGVYLYKNKGNGDFEKPLVYYGSAVPDPGHTCNTGGGSSGIKPNRVFLLTEDKDDKMDIVFNASNDGTNGKKLYIGKWNGTTFSFSNCNINDANIAISTVFDVNDDGFLDVIYVADGKVAGTKDIKVAYNDGNSCFTQTKVLICNLNSNTSIISFKLLDQNTKRKFITGTTNDDVVVWEILDKNSIPAANSAISCTGDTIKVGATLYGTYKWSINGKPTNQNTSNFIIPKLPKGQYNFAVDMTSSNCCPSNSAIDLSVDGVDLGLDKTVCFGEAVSLTAQSGKNFLWNNGSTTKAITVKPTMNSSYSVTVDFGGCKSKDTVNINVFSVVPYPLISTAKTNPCPGTISLAAPSNYISYSWSNGATTRKTNVNVKIKTTYYLTITDGKGCILKDSITIIPQNISFAVSPKTAFLCENATVNLSTSTNTINPKIDWYLDGGLKGSGANFSANQVGIWTSVLTDFTSGCALVDTAIVAQALPVQQGLIANYSLNNDLKDYGLKNYKGVIFNQVGTNNRLNKTNEATVFNGTSTYGQVSNIPLPSNKITYSLWVKPKTINTGGLIGDILSKHTSPSDCEVLIRQASDGKYGVEWNIGGQYFALSGNAKNGLAVPSTTKFDHLVLTYDGNTVKFYVNNKIVGTKNITGNIVKSIYNLTFGSSAFIISNYFNGTLDDVLIYDRALSEEEVTLIYDAGQSNSPVGKQICEGSSLTLNAPTVAGTTYKWTGPNNFNSTAAQNTISNSTMSAEGVYNLTYTSNACSFTDTAVVKLNPKPTLSLLPQNITVCIGENVPFVATTNANKLEWQENTSPFSVGANTYNFSKTTPSSNTINVKVSNTVTGCTNTATTSIGVKPSDLSCSLVAHYKLNGDAADASGNVNNGTIVGVVTKTTDHFGNCDKAMKFDGSSYITIPNSNTLNSFTSTMSISAWVKVTKFDQFEASILSKSNASYRQYGAGFQCCSPTVGSNIWFTGDNNVAQAPFDHNKDVWYHYVVTYFAQSTNFYINGKLITSVPKAMSFTPANFPLEIGRDLAGKTDYFNGSLDDIRIYKRALSEQEVKDIYNLPDEGGQKAPTVSINNTDNLLCEGSAITLSTTVTNNPQYIAWTKDGTIFTTGTTANITVAGDYVATAQQSATCFASDTILIGKRTLVSDGLVAYYPFDNDVKDYSGNANHGVNNVNITATKDRKNTSNTAYSFNGASSFITMNSQSFNLPKFTYSVWVNPQIFNSDPNVGAAVLSKYDGSSSTIFYISNTGKPSLRLHNGVNVPYSELISPTAINLNTWSFVTISFDGSKIRTYVNGLLSGEKVVTVNYSFNSSANLTVGKGSWSSSNFFQGALDEIRIYNRPLSATEIALLYDAGRSNSTPQKITACLRDTVQLSAIQANSKFSYTWTDSKGNQKQGASWNIPVNQTDISGTYNLSISDEKGCMFSDTAAVKVNTVLIPLTPATIQSCTGKSQFFSAPSDFNTQYSWYVNDFFREKKPNNTFSFSTKTPNTYNIAYQSRLSDGTCKQGTAKITVVSPPSISLVTPKDFLCPQESIKLTATASGVNTSYQWLLNSNAIGINQSAFSANLAGNYKVKVSDLIGCDSTSNSISLKSIVAPIANAGKDIVTCEDNLQLSASLPFGAKGEWSSNNPNLIFLEKEKYNTKISKLETGINKLVWKVTEQQCNLFAVAGLNITLNNQKATLKPDTIKVFDYYKDIELDILKNDDFKALPSGFELTLSEGSGSIQNNKYFYKPNGSEKGRRDAQYKVCNKLCPNICTVADIATYFITPDNGQNATVFLTPNGDGKNDTWILDYIDNYQKNEVYIYSRWGTLVWQGKMTGEGWAGTNQQGEVLPDGTYYYVINLDLSNGKTIFGDILLVKD